MDRSVHDPAPDAPMRRSDARARTRRHSRAVIEPAPRRMRVQQERRRRAVKRTALAVALALVACVAAYAVWFYASLHGAERAMNQHPEIDERLSQALTARRPQQPFNILLLGSDNRPGEEDARADTIIVARVDLQKNKVWMLSIPRDTHVVIPGYGERKINAAHFYGGPALAVDTVEQFLGIEINHYIGVNFAGFQKIVDALGGVWIDVDVEIDDPKAASHGSYKAYHIDPGYQLLDGEHALTYVRSRNFPDGDFTRMRHQQAFFKALAEQATRFSNVLKIPALVRAVSKEVSTDMSLSQLADVAMALKDVGAENLETATVPGEWRSPYVWPDEAQKRFLVDAMMAGRSFDDTSTVSNAIDPSSVTVTVRNGAGIDGCATYTAGILRGLGYKVTGVGNANQFVYDRTLVVYSSKRDAAEQIAGALPSGEVVPSRGMYEFATDILVVVGKDYATWGATQ